MSRHGYYEVEDVLEHGRWRGQVASALRGRRGQQFLAELARALDALPEKRLITEDLVRTDGDCCTLGALYKLRGLEVEPDTELVPDEIGEQLGITHQIVAEIEFQNDEMTYNFDARRTETPEERWVRMREWVRSHLREDMK